MILDRSGNNFRSGGGATIDEHDKRIFLAAIAVGGIVTLFLGGASVVRDHELAFFQELVRDADAFIEQAAGVLA